MGITNAYIDINCLKFKTLHRPAIILFIEKIISSLSNKKTYFSPWKAIKHCAAKAAISQSLKPIWQICSRSTMLTKRPSATV